MKRYMVITAFLVASTSASAADILPVTHKHPHPKVLADPCEPGFQWVEETCYKDVERLVCRMVPEVKKHKKWVYSAKPDPFCLSQSGKSCFAGPGHACGKENCGGCPSCEGPFCRIQLVKREIVTHEETIMKCVTESVVEKVAYTVRKKVPCSATPACLPAAPGAVASPALPQTLPAPDQKLPVK